MCYVLQETEAEDARHLKLQTCLALLSAAPNLRELSFYGMNLPVRRASSVRMSSGLRMLHLEPVRPQAGATTASQLIEPLVQGLCSLQNLTVKFEGAPTMAI